MFGHLNHSRIAIVESNGRISYLYDMAATDKILYVKECLFRSVRSEPPEFRQQLVFRAGPRGTEPLADNEALGDAGVAQDGTAELDVILRPMTAAEQAELDQEVYHHFDILR
jgi:hypothetical protein